MSRVVDLQYATFSELASVPGITPHAARELRNLQKNVWLTWEDVCSITGNNAEHFCHLIDNGELTFTQRAIDEVYRQRRLDAVESKCAQLEERVTKLADNLARSDISSEGMFAAVGRRATQLESRVDVLEQSEYVSQSRVKLSVSGGAEQEFS